MLEATHRRLLSGWLLASTIAALSGGARAQPEPPRLDLLFVVDNSGSMASEQAALRNQLPRLIEMLTRGERADGSTFPPFEDVHFGVVSTDMGVAGIPNNFPGCNTARHVNGGDDGLLLRAHAIPACAASLPPFLEYEAGVTDPDQLAQQLSCATALGTTGCGFEQQLEAALKALWPKNYIAQNGNVYPPEQNPILFLSTTSEGRFGHGDVPIAEGGNGGFTRADRTQGSSLLAIVLITDEEDCSSKNTSHFISTNDPNNPLSRQAVNLRCHLNQQNLFDIDRYTRGLAGLRPGEPEKVLFAAIVGVPTALVDPAARAEVDAGDPASLDAYYDRILSDPLMQPEIENDGTPVANLRPSCSRVSPDGVIQSAFPPRRIVEVAKSLGEQALVQSICQDDLTPATDALVSFISDGAAKL